MSKLFTVSGDQDYFVADLRIPQDGEAFPITVAGIIKPHGGWYLSWKVGKRKTSHVNYARTPGQWLRDNVVAPLQRLRLRLYPFPVYAAWSNYWMVDHVEDWGVKRFSCGHAYLRWFDREVESQDENRFSCGLTDRADYEAHLRAVRRESETGYRQTSRDHGLEHFENHGW